VARRHGAPVRPQGLVSTIGINVGRVIYVVFWPLNYPLKAIGSEVRVLCNTRRNPFYRQKLLSVKRFLRVVSQHAYLTPYRYVRVVEGPKHYVCYPRVNSAYVNAYGRNEPLGAYGRAVPARH